MHTHPMFSLFKFLLLIFGAISHGLRRIGDGNIQDALHLGISSANASRDDCLWRSENDQCPDPLITYTLYTRNGDDDATRSATINTSSPAWMHSSGWNPSHETVVLVHGYGGVADHLPVGVLRDAYLKNGNYNVIVVDWSPLAKIPCYVSAVGNMKSSAKCLAHLYNFLRNSGVNMDTTTCIGHSLGAHVCGIASNYLQFRMHRIIGIDPARPLVRSNPKSKLDDGDAEIVQVMHTSSNYGDPKKTGHVDFYFNGGRIQPFCSNAPNEELCSHLRSVCYLAESIFPDKARSGTRCRRRNIERRQQKDIRNRINNADFVLVGHNTPAGVLGTYCVSNIEAPYCFNNSTVYGSVHCCSPGNRPTQSTTITTTNEENIQLRDISLLQEDSL